MTTDQMLITGILLVTMAMFLWGIWRHDMVALAAMLAAVVAGLIDPAQAFAGFGHPAVITVACVLVLSRGLQTSGAVDVIADYVLPKTAGTMVSLFALVGLGALLSGGMNNVGAMALLMPIAIQLSGRLDMAPGQVLMPLAFGTILGGMTTLIGTPPNLIVSALRADAGLGGFGMFDFAPVGVAVAVAGVVFIATFGWRLVPAKRAPGTDEFTTGAYMTEALVEEKSRAIGMTLRILEAELEATEAQIVGLVRQGVHMHAPHGGRRLAQGDVLILEADVSALSGALPKLGLTLLPDADHKAALARTETAAADDKADEEERNDPLVLRELVVRPGAGIVGQSAQGMRLRTRFGLNLLAVSRGNDRRKSRLRNLSIRSGDVLLMQGPAEAVAEFATATGCLPLAERDLRLPDPRKAIVATAIMLGAIALSAFGILPAAVSFALGVLATMVFRTVQPRDVYTAIDWPVIVLLGALIPVAGAIESTGTAALIGQVLLNSVAQGNAIAALVLILVVTMFLSDVMNNAATAAVMTPIALGTATALGVNPDSFLMAVAIGASCAFLTPIGHQNNTLILGPGGFSFGDYWRLGLPLEVLVVAVSVPMLLLVWPL